MKFTTVATLLSSAAVLATVGVTAEEKPVRSLRASASAEAAAFSIGGDASAQASADAFAGGRGAGARADASGSRPHNGLDTAHINDRAGRTDCGGAHAEKCG